MLVSNLGSLSPPEEEGDKPGLDGDEGEAESLERGDGGKGGGGLEGGTKSERGEDEEDGEETGETITSSSRRSEPLVTRTSSTLDFL
jgi:hypothetical protein